MAVPPELVDFAESAGFAAVAYGLELRGWLDTHRDFWTTSSRLLENPGSDQVVAGVWAPVAECWEEIGATLKSLAEGADLLFHWPEFFGDVVANVAEYYDIPLATLHYNPVRANGQLFPILPAPLARSA